MEFVEKSANTVDEAITEGLIELQLTSDKVDIEIIDEGNKGIFGFFRRKKAVVKIIKKMDHFEVAKKFLSSVFDNMNMVVNIECIKISEKQLNINLSGENMGVLIGKRGSTLDSLQYLVSLVVNKQSNEYVRIKLDTENYRSRRKETVENLAKNLAKKVKATGKKVSLEPMNPFERRIIHSTLQKERFVETHSEGEDPYRRVIISPIKNKR